MKMPKTNRSRPLERQARRPRRSSRADVTALRPEADAHRLAIVVLGMHRSGTSALTRMISLLGADLPKNLMQPSPENETGYWESQDLVAIHDEILSSSRSNWHDWREFNRDWYASPMVPLFKRRILDVLQNDYANSPLFVIKDPRICRFWPFWREVLDEFGAKPAIVLLIRNPLEVITSLRQRGLSASNSVLLWLRHVLDAEVATRDLPRAIITFEELLADWRAVAVRLESRLKITWPRLGASRELEIETFLTPKLRHHTAATEQLAGKTELVDWVKNAYAAFARLSETSKHKPSLTALDRIREEFDKACSIFGMAVSGGTDHAARDADVAKTEHLRNQRDVFEERVFESVNRERCVAGDPEAAKLKRELEGALATLASQQDSALEQAGLLDVMERRHSIAEQSDRAQFEQLRAERDHLAAETSTIIARMTGELNEAHAALLNERHRAREQADRLLALERVQALAKEVQDRELGHLRSQAFTLSEALGSSTAAVKQLQNQVSALHHQISQELSLSDELTARVRDYEQRLAAKDDRLAVLSTASLADRSALEHLHGQIRLAALKASIEHQLASASGTVRIQSGQVPLAVTFQKSQLRTPLPYPATTRRLTRSQRNMIVESGLFDKLWYLDRNPDVRAAGIDPLKHFLKYGIMEDRDPHPLFSSGWYRIHNSHVLNGMPPFLHFMLNRIDARFLHPLFEPTFYAETNADINFDGLDALAHFLLHGAGDRLNPHSLVCMDRLVQQPGFDVSSNPLIDYLTNVTLFTASPHPLFDGSFYLSNNTDIVDQRVNPLLHYCAVGWREGRQPHPLFAGDWYLANNPDLLGVNPLEHFVRRGFIEGRSPHPLFDVSFYRDKYHDMMISSRDALTHYITVGARERHETTRLLSVDLMSAAVPRKYWHSRDPISAFMNYGKIQLTKVLHDDFSTKLTRVGGSVPSPDPSYWLPQKLRDYIIDRYGEDAIHTCLYLMSVLDRFDASPNAFHGSVEFELLNDWLSRLVAMRLPTSSRVDVSIIIPVHNNIIFTMTCLASILESDTSFSYEIIVGDDASEDGTRAVLQNIGGPVSLIHHRDNLGFLSNCNACANQAKGRYLVFLNNDTLALPHWLDELMRPLEQDTCVGLAGSKLLNADGTLQEAGGILWNDGLAWNFGRNQDPALPQFNYMKDVDYISGASIALPRDLWRTLDGFDPIYAPAYCEDSDLAFRVRAAGLRTVYAPHSSVIHHEGKSHGRDTATGFKSYQPRNQRIFLDRWRATLVSQNFTNGEHVFLARDRSRHKPHILVVDHYVPQWDRDAGSRTMYHFLRMFVACGFQVTFWPDNLNEDREYCLHLQNMGIEVLYSSAYVNRFDEFLAANGMHFQYVLVSRPHIAIKYYTFIRSRSNCKVIYYGHDIHYRRMQFELAIRKDDDLSDVIEAMRIQEFDNWRFADVVLYPSVDERDEVRRLMPQAIVEQVPMLGFTGEELSLPRRNLTRFGERDFDQLLYVGGSHPPNVDALLWFVGEIFPIILRNRGSTRLHVVGAVGNDEVARLGSNAINICGRLSDNELAGLYATAGVAVVPLRFGGGVKGKTIEALYNAIPVVSTAIGMQGISAEEPIALVAEGAMSFAQAVITTQTRDDETKLRVERGVSFIEKVYSMTAMKKAFSMFITQLDNQSISLGT
jgi:GT2 family glycosyltransferase